MRPLRLLPLCFLAAALSCFGKPESSAPVPPLQTEFVYEAIVSIDAPVDVGAAARHGDHPRLSRALKAVP